jgi:hypothetical protein
MSFMLFEMKIVMAYRESSTFLFVVKADGVEARAEVCRGLGS